MPRGRNGQSGANARARLQAKLLAKKQAEAEKAIGKEIFDQAKVVTGERLKEFLATNHEKLHAEPEGFGLVIAFILGSIASRYKDNGNLDNAKADIMHLIDDGVPPVFRYGRDTKEINTFYRDAVAEQNLTQEQNFAQAKLVSLLRAYKAKVEFLENDDYCNPDGSLKDDLTLAGLQQEFALDSDMTNFFRSKLVPQSWGEAADPNAPAISGVTAEEAKALGIQTLREAVDAARGEQTLRLEQTPEEAAAMVAQLMGMLWKPADADGGATE